MFSSGKQIDEIVTCASCDYRFPAVRHFCPMCGEEAGPREASHTAPSVSGAGILSESGTANLHDSKESESAQKEVHAAPPATPAEAGGVAESQNGAGSMGGLAVGYTADEPGRNYLIPALVLISLAVLIVALLAIPRLRRSESEAPAAAVPAGGEHTAAPQNQRAVPAAKDISPPSSLSSSPPPSSPPLSATASDHAVQDRRMATESEMPRASNLPDDPVELWQQVRRGNTRAEVALAQLYMEGSKVEKNCEEATILLNAASRKGNAEARQLLESGRGSCR